MIIENLTTLKINKLTKAQYEAALAAGTVSENELYMTEESNVDLTDFANHTLITIPAGRMRGDVDGDGKITQDDVYAIKNGTGSAGKKYYNTILSTTFPDGNVPLDYLAADINGDGLINIDDSNLLISSTFKAGAYAEITGNWTNNPNYAAEESQFYVDIPVTGMTENHSAAISVKGEFWKDTFTKGECRADAIRIYTKFCPIAESEAIISWGYGDGTAVIVTEKTKPEQNIFIAKAYETTYEEIYKAYNAGKPCFCQNEEILYTLCGFMASSFIFGALITDYENSDSSRGYYASYLRCKKTNNTWIDLCENGYVKMLNPASNGLPDVTTSDNGKILQVVDGVWTANNNSPTITTTTLLASNWDSTAKTYSFEATYPSARYDIEVDIDGDNCTDAQLEAWIAAKPLSSSINKINAKGNVPSVDIPIILTVIPNEKPVSLISFTIAGASYQAEAGMTWGEWVGSSYNTASCTIADIYIYYALGDFPGWVCKGSTSNRVLVTDEIIAGTNYIVDHTGGGGSE